MSGTHTRRRPLRRWRLLLPLAVLVIAGVIVAFLLHSRLVRWSDVLAATVRQDTVNGVGRVYAHDGSEWAVSVWVKVDASQTFPANTLLVPVKASPTQRPDEETVETAQMANYLPLLPRLARNHPSAWSRPVEWAGRRVLEATYAEGRAVGPNLAFRAYLDPQSKLIQGLDLVEHGRLVLKVQYRYNQALPANFRAK